jgi:hypothetical protein
VYPIAYDKWLDQQLRDLLGLKDLATRLVGVLDAGKVGEGAVEIERLLDEYVSSEPSRPAA